MLKPLAKTSTDLISDGLLISVGLSCATALYAGDSALPDSLLYGFGTAAAFGLISRRITWRTGRTNYAHTFKQSMGIAPTYSTNPDMRSYSYRWKPETKPDEFEFFGLGLPVKVLESELSRFIGIAQRRQSNALYGGGRLGVYRTEKGFKQLRLSWVLSKQHFCKKRRPRLPEEKYYSIMIILGYARLLDGNPRKGHAGYLAGSYSTSGYVEIAIRRWLELVAPRRRRWPMSLLS